MAMASGARMTEMNCEVESDADGAALVPAEELDEKARHGVQQHVQPEGPPGEAAAEPLGAEQQRQNQQLGAGFVELCRVERQR